MGKPKDNFIKQKHVGLIISFITFVAGWVILMKISPQVGAILIIIACASSVYLIVYYITSRLSTKWNKTIPRIILPLLTSVLLSTLLWHPIIELATPPIVELPNSYIHQTRNSAGTLLEFGVRGYDTDLDVTIVTKDGYTNVEDWWDSPRLTDRSSNAQSTTGALIIKNEYSQITIGHADIVLRNISSPIFEFKLNFPQVTPSRSYYVRFKATEPVTIQSVIFGNVTVISK
jgi:hypothetical protein